MYVGDLVTNKQSDKVELWGNGERCLPMER